jgi:O-acetylserine/cysteine efflux transporter
MPRRHSLLAVLVACGWAVNFVVIDVGLEAFPPLLFAALRFALIAVPAIFFVERPDVRWRVVVAVGLFVCVGQFGLLFVAMNTGLPAGLASVILPLQPVFTISFAVAALHERPTIWQVAGVGCALAGLSVIAAGRASDVPLRAVVLAVAAAASWGAGNVVTRAAGASRPFSLLVWSSLVGPVPLALLSLVFEGPHRWSEAASSIDASALLALGYVVVVATFFGFGVWTWLMSRYPASTVAPFTLLVPVLGVATAWLVRGEHPTAGELVGCLVALFGLGLALGLVGAIRRRWARGNAYRPHELHPQLEKIYLR